MVPEDATIENLVYQIIIHMTEGCTVLSDYLRNAQDCAVGVLNGDDDFNAFPGLLKENLWNLFGSEYKFDLGEGQNVQSLDQSLSLYLDEGALPMMDNENPDEVENFRLTKGSAKLNFKLKIPTRIEAEQLQKVLAKLPKSTISSVIVQNAKVFFRMPVRDIEVTKDEIGWMTVTFRITHFFPEGESCSRELNPDNFTEAKIDMKMTQPRVKQLLLAIVWFCENRTRQAETSSDRTSDQNIQSGDMASSHVPTGSCVPAIPESALTLKDEIGKGGFGAVYLADYKFGEHTSQLRPVAVKKNIVGSLPQGLLEDFKQESETHYQCDHVNIVRLLGVCCPSNGPPMLVLEYISGGSLYETLSDPKLELPWSQRLQFCQDVSCGLAYLHSKAINVVHRDLKSMNVLLTEMHRAKLIDFGMASIKIHTQSVTRAAKVAGKVGSLRWRAPETFERKYTYKYPADVYSLGMVLWEVAARKLPYKQELDDGVVKDFIKDGDVEDIPKDTPDVLSVIITRCWSFNPEERPTAEHICDQLRRVDEQLGSEQAVCPYYLRCQKALKYLLDSSGPNFPWGDVFDKGTHGRCFCDECMAKFENAAVVEERGNPPKRFGLPVGCARFGLIAGTAHGKVSGAFENFNLAYHGTRPGSVMAILRTNQLAKPGDTVLGGYTIPIRGGHIKKPFSRLNRYTRESEFVVSRPI
jgi:serine/threonine protein kinase